MTETDGTLSQSSTCSSLQRRCDPSLQPIVRRQRHKTRRMPSSTRCMVTAGTARTRWVSMLRSIVIICETLTTDGFASADSDFPTRTFPGASASERLDVITATITVAIRLSLNGFDWIISTGRRNAGPDPVGIGNEAHQISPRFMTQGLFLRLGKRFGETGRRCGVDFVKLGRYRNGPSGAQIRCESIRVELASGEFELPCKMLAGLEYGIGNRDCDLHV